jgi:hypothetical protein
MEVKIMSRAEYMRQYRQKKREKQEAQQGVTPEPVTPKAVTSGSVTGEGYIQCYTFQSGRWTPGAPTLDGIDEADDLQDWLAGRGYNAFEQWGTPCVRELEVFQNSKTDQHIALITLANCSDVRFVFIPTYVDMLEFAARYVCIFNHEPPYEH